MERLTYDFCIGENHCWEVHGADGNICADVCKEQGDKGCEECPIRKAIDRLAAYEDAMSIERAQELAKAEKDGWLEELKAYRETGMTPERIEALKCRALLGALESPEMEEYDGSALERADRLIAEYESIGQIEHLRELAQAEKEGRLTVPHDKARWVMKVLEERDRQDLKWGFPQKNTFCEWSSILAEEAGELAKELNELNFGRGDFKRMEAEAVHVAAVALSILEQSSVAHGVTVQTAAALGRLTLREAEAALKKREADDEVD